MEFEFWWSIEHVIEDAVIEAYCDWCPTIIPSDVYNYEGSAGAHTPGSCLKMFLTY